MKIFYVYILASGKHGTLYIGVTSQLLIRAYQHKLGSVDGFTKKYGVNKLVYFEIYDDINEAILREKRLKKWNRDWKTRLIEEKNPGWVESLSNFRSVIMDSRLRGNDNL